MSTIPGWVAHTTIAVTKEPALVQMPRVVTLVDVMEKYSEYMLVEELMDESKIMPIATIVKKYC